MKVLCRGVHPFCDRILVLSVSDGEPVAESTLPRGDDFLEPEDGVTVKWSRQDVRSSTTSVGAASGASSLRRREIGVRARVLAGVTRRLGELVVRYEGLMAAED